jgi:lipoyl(octanoyl) transferase
MPPPQVVNTPRHRTSGHGRTPCYRAAVELRAEWLGRIGYQDAWDRQHTLVAARAAGETPDTLLMLEHDAVLTLGRNADPAHIRVPDEVLAARGIKTLRVERGGEVTYHGPGQLVAYPIVRLSDAGLLLRPFVRALELAMADTARSYGIPAERRDGYPGCWVDPLGVDGPPRKLGALGLRVEKGVTYHGIACNVTTDLADFELIEPCGLTGISVTSVARELGWSGDRARPSTASVRAAAERFEAALRTRLDDAVVASTAPRPALSPA